MIEKWSSSLSIMIKSFFADVKTSVSQPSTNKITTGQVLVSRIPVYELPDQTTMQVSQLLYGELYDVYEKNDIIKDKNWYLIQSQRDHYVGYIYVDEITPIHFSCNAKVGQLSTALYAKPNMKSLVLYELPLGAEIDVVTESEDSDLNLEVEHNDYYFSPSLKAWVFKKHLILNNQFHLDPVAIARQFIGLSYLWGGRSGWGCDCSSLVQLCYELCGCILPRDSHLQVKFSSAFEQQFITMDKVQAGDLLFWPGHVAIACSATRLIHATCVGMHVVEELIETVDQRNVDENQVCCTILRPILPINLKSIE